MRTAALSLCQSARTDPLDPFTENCLHMEWLGLCGADDQSVCLRRMESGGGIEPHERLGAVVFVGPGLEWLDGGRGWCGRIARSQSKNSGRVLFLRKRLDGKARRGKIPAPVSRRGATNPAGLFRENPPGDRSFVRVQRCLGRYSPQWGCSNLSALATAKIPGRRTPRNFQTASRFAHSCPVAS